MAREGKAVSGPPASLTCSPDSPLPPSSALLDGLKPAPLSQQPHRQPQQQKLPQSFPGPAPRPHTPVLPTARCFFDPVSTLEALPIPDHAPPSASSPPPITDASPPPRPRRPLPPTPRLSSKPLRARRRAKHRYLRAIDELTMAFQNVRASPAGAAPAGSTTAAAAGSRRAVVEPQCTHLHMTRLYDPGARCVVCHRPGRFGWVYQCTQDQENLIEHAVATTGLEVFDRFGKVMCAQLTLQERSPAAREDRLSFLDEITPELMAQYLPDQLAAILRQRDNVQRTIRRAKLHENNAAILGRPDLDGGGQYGFNRPWVARAHEVCQYMVCPSCRPAAADRAFLSLDAVAKGEIQPTAAAGYGFHLRGERPVVNAHILANIGRRRPTQEDSPRRGSAEAPSFESEFSIMERLEKHIAREHSRWTIFPGHGAEEDDHEEHVASPDLPPPPAVGDETLGHLKHSPKCDNLAAFSEPHELVQPTHDRPPWTPPPSPAFRRYRSTSEIDAVAGPSSAAGSVPSPLVAGIEHDDWDSANLHPPRSDHVQASRPGTPSAPPPASPPEASTPPPLFDDAAYGAACATPLSPPDAEEEQLLGGWGSPATDESGDSEGRFTTAPLKVGHGVAMMEESVELEIPDVITET